MQKHFADWYRVAHLEPKGDDILKRGPGVEAFTKEVDTSKSMDCVRAFSSGCRPRWHVLRGFEDDVPKG